MVDTNPCGMNEQDIVTPEHVPIDQSESATDICFSNVMALIKLRQNKVFVKIAKGVFRCILECQLPKVLCWRCTELPMPIQGKQQRHFPPIEKLNYNNCLVAVNEILNHEYQFILSDGTNCGTKSNKEAQQEWTRISIKNPQTQVKKIEMGYNEQTNSIRGLRFYSKDGELVLKTGYDWVANDWKTHTVRLADGERVIGYKSRVSIFNPNGAWHCDLQLIVGRLI